MSNYYAVLMAEPRANPPKEVDFSCSLSNQNIGAQGDQKQNINQKN